LCCWSLIFHFKQMRYRSSSMSPSSNMSGRIFYDSGG
jgi:hypothetical protein